MIVEGFSTGGSILVALVALIGWFSVQIFAWVLGVFSPNIHAARLHFVEWMRQFYTASGRALHLSEAGPNSWRWIRDNNDIPACFRAGQQQRRNKK